MAMVWYIMGFFFVGMPTGYYFRENNIPAPITMNVEAIKIAVKKITG
jgi:hypothetical protein